MAGSAAAESILFIAAVLIASAFVGVVTTVVGGFSEGVDDRGRRLADQLRSDITIINDPEAVPVSPNVIVYIKNTGDSTLTPVDMSILLDGQVAGAVTFDVLDSTDDETWPPGTTVAATVTDLGLAAGDHRIRAVASNGAAATLEVRV